MFRSARAIAALLVAGLVFGTPALAHSEDVWAPQTFTLANGMRAVVLPDHRAPVVTHMIWYRVGSADETPGKSGLAHFLEHLMFKSTSDRPAGDYSRTIARNGGQDNATTSYDYTNYHFRIAKDRLSLMMQLEADRMVNLQLGDSEVLPERKVVQEERRQTVESTPAAILEEMISEKLYAGHPYSVPVVGRMDEVAKLTRADALDWYRTWYGPENAILVVSGDITAAELKPLAEKIYGGIPRRGNLKVRAWPALPALRVSSEVTYRDPKVTQPVWTRTWQGVRMGDADAAALQVGMQVLGGGRVSRLYRELVEGGDAVSAWAYSSELEAGGAVSLSISPSQGVDMEDVRAAASKITAALLKTGPSQKELDLTKKMMAAEATWRRDSQMKMAEWYGGMLTAGMSVRQIQDFDARIAAVTTDQVKAALNKYLGAPHVDGLLLPEPS